MSTRTRVRRPERGRRPGGEEDRRGHGHLPDARQFEEGGPDGEPGPQAVLRGVLRRVLHHGRRDAGDAPEDRGRPPRAPGPAARAEYLTA